MLIDGRTIGKPDALTADLCVVGGGAAGVSLALELLDSPRRVLLLEQGGATRGNGDEGLHRVVGGPPPHLVHDPDRAWYFGGSTNHWFGNCRPLDEGDFQRREWIPGSDWPVRRDELVPFYERAQQLCGLGDFRLYDLDACRPHLRHQPLDVKSGVLVHRMLQTCPQPRLAVRHRRRLQEAANVQIVTGARVTGLETTARGDAVTAAHGVMVGGRRLRVTARAFVLATGGIGNPRLLLCSGDAHPAGLGNRHDLVGRFFMEHVHVDVPVGSWSDGRDLNFYTGRQPVEMASVWGHLALSEDFMRAERAPGQALWFQRAVPHGPSVAAAVRLRRLLLGRAWPDAPLQDLATVLANPRDIMRLAWHTLSLDKVFGIRSPLVLRVQLEQTPDSRNRVFLSTARDRVGQRRVELTLLSKHDEEDRHARSLRVAADAIGLDGPRVASAMRDKLRSGHVGFFWHHMGTTRMGEDPREGVVDANCQVHGVSNLFIAGSSVFPTGGTAGPTLTIIALALRLATHLRQRYA